jgi:Raf kinase inhibitor-like YbhB/YbcL family protein
MSRRRAGVMALAVAIGLAGCRGSNEEEAGGMELRSDAFEDGGEIPARYTCDGEDVSPPLSWSGVPEGTVAFALVADDPDAGGFVHWVLADIPADATELPEGEGDAIGMPGRNDFGRPGWGGPCPPRGEHRYVFTLYALSEPLAITGEPDAESVRGAVGDRVLAETKLTGRYTRGG